MRLRGGLLIAALLVLGAVGGFVLARAAEPAEHRAAVASPLPAEPNLPVDPTTPPAKDIDYPTLQPGLAYEPRTLGDPPFAWDYEVPKGWTSELVGPDELRWRPPDEPQVGGFSVRVKIVNTHQSPAEMVEAKQAALAANPEAYVGFTVLSQTDDTLAFSYRVPSSNTLRFNTFRWIASPDNDEAGVEMSVVGRERDHAGLADLLERVAASFTPR